MKQFQWPHGSFFVLVVAVLAFLLRMCYATLTVDLQSDNYWEYGEIAKNLHAGRGYSLFSMEGSEINIVFNPSVSPFPSAFMPPAYPLFLFPFLSVENVSVRNLLILSVQAGIGFLLVLAIYETTRRFFTPFSALVASIIVAVLPEFVYASSSFTPVVIYQLGVLILVLHLDHVEKHGSIAGIIRVALLSVFLIYLRSEFVLFCAAAPFILLQRRRIRAAVQIAFLMVLLLIPWQVRNYLVFGSFVPLTTNAGLNFFRGNNPVAIGSWGDEIVLRELKQLEPGVDFELRMQGIFVARAWDTIVNNPWHSLTNGFVKVVHLWVISPNDDRAQNLWYLVPWGFIMFFFLIGMGATRSWRRHTYLYLFLICSSLVAFVFFALPRYQTMMKTAIVPFAAYGIETLLKRLGWLKKNLRPGD